MSLAVSGNMIFHGMVWGGLALLAGSIICFVAGSGARGGLHLGQRKSALIIGAVLMLIGMTLPFYLEVTVRLFRIDLAGDTWAALGAVIGWFAARPEDAGAFRTSPPLAESSERTLLNDADWSPIDGEACRVLEFTPLAKVENGEVISVNSMPYASVSLECTKLPPDSVGFVTHKEDFQNLWSAFMERGIQEDEEAIIFWSKRHLKPSARPLSAFMPRLWVTICKKGAYELMTDPDRNPELQGEARYLAIRPIEDWKPDAFD
jgi:hypothetical protein